MIHGGEAMTVSAEEHELERLSVDKLLDNLIGLADNNTAFKLNKMQKTAFTVAQAELFDVMPLPDSVDDESEEEDEDDTEGTSIGIEYEFEAERVRSDDFGTFIVFQYSLTAIHEGIDMPENIAAEAFGLHPKEAVKEAGPSTLRRSLTFNITTLDGELAVCESYTYLDKDGDIVTSGCTCKDQSMVTRFYGGAIMHESDGDGSDGEETDESSGVSVIVPTMREASEHEVCPPETPEDALVLWAGVNVVDREFMDYSRYTNLKLAFSTFSRMKAALRKQAGD